MNKQVNTAIAHPQAASCHPPPQTATQARLTGATQTESTGVRCDDHGQVMPSPQSWPQTKPPASLTMPANQVTPVYRQRQGQANATGPQPPQGKLSSLLHSQTAPCGAPGMHLHRQQTTPLAHPLLAPMPAPTRPSLLSYALLPSARGRPLLGHKPGPDHKWVL